MKPTPIIEQPTGGLNLVDPEHKLREGQVRVSQNFIARNNKVTKIGGTTRYNATAVSGNITWAERYYGRTTDGTEIKKAFAFANGTIYVGDDVAGSLASSQGAFQTGTYPESEVIQVSGRSLMFFFNEGLDVPYTYDGNESNSWQKSAITYKFVQGILWLDRLWAFEKNSNQLYYSKTLYPDNFTDTTDAGSILIGQQESTIVGLVLYGDYLYIFKENSIYYIEGRTPTEFAVRVVNPFLGCNSRLSIINVETAVVFLGSDNELYSFRGTQASTRNVTKDLNFKDLLNKNKVKTVACGYHDDLLRVSYEPSIVESTTVYNSDEIIAPVLEPNSDELPRWSHSRGANISRYSVWNRFGDKNELVTGRSDLGCLMYHNRGKNFDGKTIEVKLRSRSIVFAEGYNARISHYNITAKPVGDYAIDFRTYLNGRLADFSSNQFNMKGEIIGRGLINFSNQVRMNDRIIPFLDKNRGNSIIYELYDNTLNTDFEIYDITMFVRLKEKLISQTTGA